MRVLNRAFDHPSQLEERAVMPLAGGIVQHGYQCGMLWGSALAAGAQAYRLLGPGPQAEAQAMLAAERLVESFRTCNKHKAKDCLEITEMDWRSTTWRTIARYIVKGEAIGCFRMAPRFAQVALGEIEAALADGRSEAPPAPVSCAAVLARRMGASDLHAAMASGLAGGIGLSGGGCGALGAAIWLLGVNSLKEGAKIDYRSPRAMEVIDKFIKSTDFKFECSEIVGRRFESVGDHASYLRDGGCSEILEVLATA